MNELITPELSDEILKFLTEKIELGDFGEFRSHDFPHTDRIGVNVMDALLDDLREKGLIDILSRGHVGYDYSYEISINKAALDFQRHGGFSGLDHSLKVSLEKLVKEVADLPAHTKQRIIPIVEEIENYLKKLGEK